MDSFQSDDCSPVPDDCGSGNGGEWNWVSGGKKGKGKKKRLKNARTLSLQTFISEHGSGASESGSTGPDPESIMTPEEVVARDSLLAYFSDLIRRYGPMKIDGPQLLNHLEERLSDGDTLIGRNALGLDQLPRFLSASPDLILVDDFVCEKSDSAKAQSLALTNVLERFSTLSLAQPLGPPGKPPPPPGNVWKKGPPGLSSPIDSFLQLPKVGSLFNGNSGFGGITRTTPTTTATVPLPDLSSPPPPLPPARTDVEALNRSLSRVTTYNTELLDQLKDQVAKNQALQQRLLMTDTHLNDAKEEIARLSSVRNDNSMISALRKELENERLVAHKLQHQLELERANSKSGQEKNLALAKTLRNLTDVDSAASTPPPCTSPGTRFGDSFGLQNLVANATSPQNTFNGHLATYGGGGGGGISAQQIFNTERKSEDLYAQFKRLGS